MKSYKNGLLASVGGFAMVLTSAIVFVPPIFAQAESEGAVPPSFEEPWGDAASSSYGPVLAPAPEEPLAAEPESMFVPPPPVGLIERPGLTPISPTNPELMSPASPGLAAGGFHSFDGGFHGPIR